MAEVVKLIVIGGTGDALTDTQKDYTQLLNNIARTEARIKSMTEFRDNAKRELAAEIYTAIDKTETSTDELGLTAGLSSEELQQKIRKENPAIVDHESEISGYDELIQQQEANLESLQAEQKSVSRKSYASFIPTNLTSNIHIQLVEGIHSPGFSTKYQQAVQDKNYVEAAKRTAKDTYDMVTAKSEKKRVQEIIESLKVNGELPNRVVLSGHSRGAATCIEVARQIYLQHRDTVKVDLIINDPVPGPMRHLKSKKVIPPNVESVVITYAGQEKSDLLKPLNLHKIFYDKTKTAVTAVILPMQHSGMHRDIKNITQAFWDRVINKTDKSMDPIPLASDVNYKISDNRKNRIQQKKYELPNNNNETLNQFHRGLTEGKMRIVNEHPVDGNSNKKFPETRAELKAELNRIYNEGRAAIKQAKAQIQSAFQMNAQKDKVQPAGRNTNKELPKTPVREQLNEADREENSKQTEREARIWNMVKNAQPDSPAGQLDNSNINEICNMMYTSSRAVNTPDEKGNTLFHYLGSATFSKTHEEDISFVIDDLMNNSKKSLDKSAAFNPFKLNNEKQSFYSLAEKNGHTQIVSAIHQNIDRNYGQHFTNYFENINKELGKLNDPRLLEIKDIPDKPLIERLEHCQKQLNELRMYCRTESKVDKALTAIDTNLKNSPVNDIMTMNPKMKNQITQHLIGKKEELLKNSAHAAQENNITADNTPKSRPS